MSGDLLPDSTIADCMLPERLPLLNKRLRRHYCPYQECRHIWLCPILAALLKRVLTLHALSHVMHLENMYGGWCAPGINPRTHRQGCIATISAEHSLLGLVLILMISSDNLSLQNRWSGIKALAMVLIAPEN